MHCVLVGNYGAGNVGDEALREYFLQAFPAIEWVVVSARRSERGEVPRLPFGVRSLFRPWWKTLIAIARADAVVFGGGTLFTDIESLSACLMWRQYAAVARFFRRPYFLAFQGVGPFKTILGEEIAQCVFERAAFVSVRDQQSFDRIHAWNLRSQPVLTSDPALALFASHQKTVVTGRKLAVIPRSNSGDEFVAIVKERVSSGAWDSVRIFLMQPDAGERGVAARIQVFVPSAEITEIESVQQLLEDVGGATEVVTQRYHGALAAMALGKGVHIVPQASGDKLSALAAELTDTKGWCQKRLASIAQGRDALAAAFSWLN